MSITKQELDDIIAKYNRGEPTGYTDEEYDVLLEQYIKEHGESSRPFTRQKQSSSVNDLVGTLGKCYLKPMHENQIYYQDYIKKKQYDFKMCMQPKFDGCSVAVDFTTNKFFTRGDYDNGESLDVTELFAGHLSIVKKYALPNTIAMKFEAIIAEENFLKAKEEMGKNYKRARDMVAAILTPPYNYARFAKYITLIPLRGISKSEDEWAYIPGFTASVCMIDCYVTDYDVIESFAKGLLANGASIKIGDFTFAVDGVVISSSPVCDGGIPIINVNQEFAIKIITNVKETKLLRIDYQFGKQGRITPVAILDPPAEFGNVKVDHVTLSTLQRVVDMDLRHNDTVRIMYNIVPYFLESYHDGDYKIPIPDKCPICHAPLDYLSYKLVRCSNPKCKGLQLGAIIRHAEKMKMVGLGEGVITKLFDNDFVSCISELYDLRKWDDCIAQTPGFGYTSYDNMVKSVDRALADATLERFLGALPFNDTDEKTWKNVVGVIGHDELIQSMVDGSFPDTIMSIGYIHGIGTVKIQKMIDGYLRHKAEIQELMSWVPKHLRKPLPKHIFKKGRVCFTGFRDKELENQLIENGWDIGGCSKDSILIVPDLDYTSDKVRKAKELGLTIYTRDMVPEFMFQPF